MGKRKHIPYRTLYAMALLALGRVPYEHAKAMGESNFLSLWHRDHNILHETGDPDCDEFWNLTPRLIREHREKTKRDAAIIAKGRRIRSTLARFVQRGMAAQQAVDQLIKPKRKLRSRGFDQRYRRKMSGKVVKR